MIELLKPKMVISMCKYNDSKRYITKVGTKANRNIYVVALVLFPPPWLMTDKIDLGVNMRLYLRS